MGHSTDSASFQGSTQLILSPLHGANTCPVNCVLLCPQQQGTHTQTCFCVLSAAFVCLLRRLYCLCPILAGEGHWRPGKVCYLLSCGIKGPQSNRHVHSAERLLLLSLPDTAAARRGSAAFQSRLVSRRQASPGLKLAAAVQDII